MTAQSMHPALLTRALDPVKLEIKVLFPYLQLSILTALTLVMVAPTGWVIGVYCVALLSWQMMLSIRFLAYFTNPNRRICTNQTAMSLVVALWHGSLGYVLNIPFATAIMVFTVLTVALFGYLCHDSRK
jgi:hypothetical protein